MAAKPHKRRNPTKKKSQIKRAVPAPSNVKTAEPVAAAKRHSLPSVIKLSKQSGLVLWRNKVLFGGIIAIYGLLNIIFVTGLSSGIDVAAIRNQFSSQLIGGLVAYTQLITTPTSSSNQTAGVYQLLLFIIVSLALIWALRQVHAERLTRIRDAYYKGMYPLIPAIIVLLVIALQLLPMIIGSTVYQLAVTNGFVVSSVEIAFWIGGTLAFSLLSLYFLASSMFAYYIVTLPDMTPVKALRSAKQLVKGRRWLVLRKLLFLPLVLLLVTIIPLIPIILLVPIAAQFCLLIAGPVLIAMTHAYLYTLYRELMND